MPEDVAELTTDRIRARLVPGRGTKGGYSLIVDGVTQSHVNPGDPLDLQLEYVQMIAAAIDGTRDADAPVAVLHLGGGALTVPRYVATTRPGSRQRVVELFGELHDFVVEHLPLPEGDIVSEFRDAREAVRDLPDESFAVAIVDVFSGDVAPQHITTAEFFAELERVLTPGGLVVVNTLATRGLDFTTDILATLGEGFDKVIALGNPDVLAGERIGNVVVVASRVPIDAEGIRRAIASAPRRIDVLVGPELEALARRGSVRRD